MFTGIIETKTAVVDTHSNEALMRLTVRRPQGWDVAIGQSIAVSGVCLTVVSADEQTISFELITETRNRTLFGHSVPSCVNLERSLLPTDRFEGHIVQGHVDTTGTVVDTDESEASMLTVQFDPSFSDLVVPKGSVTINGVSLTTANLVDTHTLRVALIPHTIETTTFSDIKQGDTVNIEFDIIGKYLLHKQNT